MTTDNRTHRTVLAAINPVVGGAGGMPHRDGANGSGADAAYLKNTPIEITEAEVPCASALRAAAGLRWRRPLARRVGHRDGVPRFAPNPDHRPQPRPVASGPGAYWAAGPARPPASCSTRGPRGNARGNTDTLTMDPAT